MQIESLMIYLIRVRGALFLIQLKHLLMGQNNYNAFHRVQIATSTTSLANCTSFSDITQSATFKFKFLNLD